MVVTRSHLLAEFEDLARLVGPTQRSIHKPIERRFGETAVEVEQSLRTVAIVGEAASELIRTPGRPIRCPRSEDRTGIAIALGKHTHALPVEIGVHETETRVLALADAGAI